MWFMFFDRISEFEKLLTVKYKSNAKAETALTAIADVLESLLFAMAKNLSLDAILEVLVDGVTVFDSTD